MRHAQRHWLGVQASQALERAMSLRDDLLTDEVADFIRVASQVQGAVGSTQIALLRARETALADAAAALTRAELLHRAAVACPERDDPANACPACGRVSPSRVAEVTEQTSAEAEAARSTTPGPGRARSPET